MKAYIITTGSIFGIIALLHLWRSIAEWPHMKTEPSYFVESALGVVAAALSVWAWRLLRIRSRQ